MKHFHLVIIVICLSIICTLFNSVVFALDQDEVRVTVAWSSETHYLGSSPTFSVFLISNSSEELTIYYFGLHSDWMDSDRFIGYDLSANPVIIPPYGNHLFTQVTFQIPGDISVGSHSYFVGIDGVEGVSTSFSWDSPTLTLVVQNSGLEVYSGLVTKVASDITEAVEAEYQSSEAQSLLDQAENAYSQALSYATEENWDKALSALQTASSYLEQADTEEQNYVEPKSQEDSLLIIIGAAVGVVVAVLIAILLLKKRQHISHNQSTET
jgi:hypothetical protein